MQLGIHTGTFRRPTITGALEATLRCGLRYVHLNLRANGSTVIEPEAAAAAARMLVETGMRVASLSGTFNMAHPDAAVRSRGLAQLAELVPLAEHFQAPVVSLCTGTRHPDSMWRAHPDNPSPEAWGDFVRTLEEALRLAECYQVILGIEPEPANIVANARIARRLLDEYPSAYLKIIFDPANLVDARFLEGRRAAIDEGIDLLGPDIVLAHAKELAADGTAGGLPPGTGILDWRHIFGQLHQTGFDGCVILHGLDESDVPDAVRFLDACLDNA